MDNLKNIVIGGIVTVVIGGTAYSFSQQDLVDNFVAESGLSQQEATQYIENIPQEKFSSFGEMGEGLVAGSESLRESAITIDCENLDDSFELAGLDCQESVIEMLELANAFYPLGEAYIKLSSESATKNDVEEAIILLDTAIPLIDSKTLVFVAGSSSVSNIKKMNILNKSLLQTILDSY